MEYLDSEQKTELISKIFIKQKLYIVSMFLYLIGIIIQVTALVVTPKGVLNLVTLMIAPICTIGLIYFTDKLYDFRASAYNRFGSEGIYHNLTIFWGNKKLPIAALVLSLVIAISSFFNFFTLEMSNPNKTDNVQIRELQKIQKGLQEQVFNIATQLKEIKSLDSQQVPKSQTQTNIADETQKTSEYLIILQRLVNELGQLSKIFDETT